MSTLRLGLVCISEMLRKDRKLAFKAMTRKQFVNLSKISREHAIKELNHRCMHNVNTLYEVVKHCVNIGISHYRVSSSLFPLITDPTLDLSLQDLPSYESMANMLMSCGNFCRANNLSFSCHPDQFNVLASYSDKTIEQSIRELNHQSNILDLMGAERSPKNPMTLHINLKPNLEKESLRDFVSRFVSNVKRCSEGVQKRLVLENDDKGFWNARMLYENFADKFPLVYDNLHHACNPTDDNEPWHKIYAKTWGEYTPVFHWSQGINGGRSHTDYASEMPSEVMELSGAAIWEVELKAKDYAIMEILKNYEKSEKK
jgi:UV DNA damage endonuclease